jgi:hypothetical protein
MTHWKSPDVRLPKNQYRRGWTIVALKPNANECSK